MKKTMAALFCVSVIVLGCGKDRLTGTSGTQSGSLAKGTQPAGVSPLRGAWEGTVHGLFLSDQHLNLYIDDPVPDPSESGANPNPSKTRMPWL